MRIADDQRLDLALALAQGKTQFLKSVPQSPAVMPQRKPPLRLLVHKVNRSNRHGHHGRRKRGGEDKTPRAVDQKLAQLAGACHIGAERPERLSQGPHLNRDAVSQPQLGDHPRPVRPEDASSMGLVDHDHRTVSLRKIYNLRKRRLVSIHTEEGLRNDQLADPCRSVFQAIFQDSEITVGIDHDRCPREAAAVDDARMIQRVTQNYIPFAGESGKDADIGLIAGVENQRSLRSLERRNLRLQLFVQRHVSRYETGGPGAAAVPLDRFLGSRTQGRMIGKAEVVIGGKIQHLLAVKV